MAPLTPTPAPPSTPGWINSIATVIPSIAGVDLEGLVRQATGDATWESSQPIYRFDGADGERIEVFLEFS